MHTEVDSVEEDSEELQRALKDYNYAVRCIFLSLDNLTHDVKHINIEIQQLKERTID